MLLKFPGEIIIRRLIFATNEYDSFGRRKEFPWETRSFFILNLFTDFLTSPSFYKMLIFSMLELFFELNIAKIKLIKITFLINIITKDILKGSVDVKPLKPFAADSDTLKDFSFCQLPTANYKRDDCNTRRLLDRVTFSVRQRQPNYLL